METFVKTDCLDHYLRVIEYTGIAVVETEMFNKEYTIVELEDVNDYVLRELDGNLTAEGLGDVVEW